MEPTERLTLALTADVRVTRRPTRRRCPLCRRKRVLYAIGLIDTRRETLDAETRARCLHCWGVRDESA